MASQRDYTRHMAAPVSRDGFFYGARGMFVKSGDTAAAQAHYRRDSATLHALLTYTPPTGPVLTKKGEIAKRQPPPHKDETGHFYTAQLQLYGLKSLKTKEAAKKHLLAAFAGGKTLSAAPHIVQLEQEMKIEWEKANRLAVDAHYAEKARLEQRQQENVARQRVSYEKIVNGEDEGHRLRGLLGTLTHEQLVELVVGLARGDPDLLVEVEEAAMDACSVKHPPRTKQTAVKSVPFALEADVEPQRVRSKQTAVKGKGVPAMEQELDEPPSARRTKQTARKTGGAKVPAKQPAQTSSSALMSSGTYSIIAPYLAEEWSCYAHEDGFRLTVHPSSTNAHLWGAFEFGVISGVFKTIAGPPSDLGNITPFKWRGREEGEGEMTFGKENKGTITFLSNGRVKGSIDGSFLGKGKATFAGTLVQGSLLSNKDVEAWKQEWRGINPRSYEAANRGRWGGWVEEPSPERPSSSDTSEDERDDEDDEGTEEEDGYMGGFYS